MKLIPIIYSGMMVQAKLAGRKTVTRRLIKIKDLVENPDRFYYVGNSTNKDVARPAIKYDDRIWYEFGLKNNNSPSWVDTCPFGNPGDILWTRETCCAHEDKNGMDGVLYKADSAFIEIENTEKAVEQWMKLLNYGGQKHRDVPSIHMPKWACRIWDKVISIRPERLHDITEEDAIAEGVESNECQDKSECISQFCKTNGCSGIGEYFHYSNPMDFDLEPCYSAVESFQTLWIMINGKDSWLANPWVWRIEYLSTTKPE